MRLNNKKIIEIIPNQMGTEATYKNGPPHLIIGWALTESSDGEKMFDGIAVGNDIYLCSDRDGFVGYQHVQSP